MIRRLALSGLLCAGKDHVAKAAGYEIESFAKPLYAMAKYFFGTDDKTIPEIRRFMQIVGQWGWNVQSPEYPNTIERALMVGFLRHLGASVTRMYEYQWHQFGRDREFWVRGLLSRVANHPYDTRIAVTNVRFAHEIKPLQTAGFEHYIVSCTHGTRERRNGALISHDVNEDKSETFARVCLGEYPDDKIIWNDDEFPMPGGRKYLTLDQFVKLATE